MGVKVSVVVPCHNGAGLVCEAVASVAAQIQVEDSGVLPQVEVVVVDDRSDDPETLAALDACASMRGVRVISNKGRAGAAAARNSGIAAADGEWIAFLDADDVWLPEAMAVRWNAIVSHPDAEWIGTDFNYLQPDGTLAPGGGLRPNSAARRILAAAYSTGLPFTLKRPVAHLLESYLVWTSTVMVKRELLGRVGGFCEELRKGEDTYLWILLAQRADLLFIPRVTALYRQRFDSLTHVDEAPGLWERRLLEMLSEQGGMRPFRREIKSAIVAACKRDARYYRSRRDRFRALSAAATIIRLKPTTSDGYRHLLAAALGRR